MMWRLKYWAKRKLAAVVWRYQRWFNGVDRW